MTAIVVGAVLTVAVVYLAIGVLLCRGIFRLTDHLPIRLGLGRHVRSGAEFSATTVASTLSLATVILAFFELAPYLGLWLFWSVVTTGLGILFARLAARRIVQRMSAYGDRRPTVHEFLAVEYGSPGLAGFGAACTSVGYLGAMSVELYVGSTFLAGLIPGIPKPLIISGLALVGIAYTAAGGFRAVVVTDRLQMRAIWALLAALLIFYVMTATTLGWPTAIGRVPLIMRDLSWRPGLGAFLVGIFLINVPAYLSDMGVWQRIAGTRVGSDVTRGLSRSVVSASSTWALFVLLACGAPIIASSVPGENPLLATVRVLGGSGPSGRAILFVVVLGLYGAMLSTASTHLIVVAHAIQQDILNGPWRRAKSALDEGARAVTVSRWITLGASVGSTAIVVVLYSSGFSISDLVFAIYGAQLSLFPAVALALVVPRKRIGRLGTAVPVGVVSGFLAGWGTAVVGRLMGSGTAVFLAPAASLGVSSFVVCGAWFARPRVTGD